MTRAKKRATKGRRRIAFWVGLLLLFGGLAALLWVAWQIWGTNWISHQEQQREVKLFKSGDGPPALLKVPRFGADYVVPINEGISDAVLAKGIGRFPKSAAPGAIGNYALAGHRITHGQPFAKMLDLRPGDLVEVLTHKATYVYVIDTDPRSLKVPFTAAWVLAPDPVNPGGGPQARQGPQERIITLATCAELFRTDDRTVVFGHLLRVDKPTR